MTTIELPEELKLKLSERGVLVVYLYGSAALGLPLPRDLDFACLFKQNSKENSFELFGKLYSLFGEFFKEEIDILILNQAPIDLQFEVINTGKALFESSLETRLDFEEKVMMEYIEFKPYLEEYHKAVFEAFH